MLASLRFLFARDASAEPERLWVQAQLKPSSAYVGQAVDLTVGVVAGGERPEIRVPKISWADVTFVANDPLRPLSVSAIGDRTVQRNLFRSRYRLIPRRAGTMAIPPISARVGDQAGVSAPMTLTVKSPPEAGKTGDFLGGVGPFEVEAVAEPSSVRLGQALEFRVTIRGEAARGVKASPRIDRLRSVPLGLEIQAMPDQVVADPPSHTFIDRLRPTRPGEGVLPPVRIAALDPKTGLYLTRATASVPIRVADVPGFASDSLRYGPDSPQTQVDRRPPLLALAFAVLTLTACVILFIQRRARRGTIEIRWGIPVRRRLERARSEPDCARVITEGLIQFLGLTVDRPPGALTPREAEEGIALATGSDTLATRARDLVAECDRLRFGEDPNPVGALRSAGFGLIDDLARGSKTR